MKYRCLPGWAYFSGTGSCYKVMSNKVTWPDADSYCWNNYKTHSVSIHSDAEFKWVNNLVLTSGYSIDFYGYWTGGNVSSSGVNQWTDGTPWDYTMPQGFCSPITQAMKLLNALLNLPTTMWAVCPTIPIMGTAGACAHMHFKASLTPVCKWTPIL